MNQKEKVITGIYIRVSTEDQAKDGFSIHAQKEKLTKYAEANDWSIYDFYIDDGISGKNLEERPEVLRMLKDIKNGKIGNVLIYKLDRLTRSVKDLIFLIELFEKNNCTFNSQTEKIDTSNAVGRMFVKIIGIFAEFERENLAERVSFGYEQKTREGNYTNTNGVYGYDYIQGEQKLIVNDNEKELVNRIFDLYIKGDSYWKISKLLNEENVATKRGGHWSASTIKSIITNPLYIGKVRYGINFNNKDRSFTTEGKNIEPIISEEKWNMARSIVATRKHFGLRRYPSENSYFFHTLKCGKCNGLLFPRQQYRDGKLYITYRCNNASKGFCDSHGFSHFKMEKSFLDYLGTLKKMKQSKNIMEKPYNHLNSKEKINSINLKIEKLENKKKMLKEQFLNDLINIDEYHELTEEIQKKLQNQKENLKELSEEEQDSFSYDDIKNLVTNIKLNWEYLTNKERQQFLERFIETIKVMKSENDNVIINSVKFKSQTN